MKSYITITADRAINDPVFDSLSAPAREQALLALRTMLDDGQRPDVRRRALEAVYNVIVPPWCSTDLDPSFWQTDAGIALSEAHYTLNQSRIMGLMDAVRQLYGSAQQGYIDRIIQDNIIPVYIRPESSFKRRHVSRKKDSTSTRRSRYVLSSDVFAAWRKQRDG